MRLKIRNLKVMASIGVYEWEKHARQLVRFNLEIDFDGDKAAASDALADTLDYDALGALVAEAAQARHYHLLEVMVEAVGRALLAVPGIRVAEVEAEKPGALAHAEAVAIFKEFSR